MILLATIVALVLMVWALVLARQPGTPTGRLCWMAGGLFLGTGAAWLVVLVGLGRSLWALFNEQGNHRNDLLMAGLGVAALAGLGLLLACLPALVLLIIDTRELVRRIDAQRPPLRF